LVIESSAAERRDARRAGVPRRLLGPIKLIDIVQHFRLLSYRSLDRSFRWPKRPNIVVISIRCARALEMAVGAFSGEAAVGLGPPTRRSGGHAAMGAGLFARN
jgi:hypothetical protein